LQFLSFAIPCHKASIRDDSPISRLPLKYPCLSAIFAKDNNRYMKAEDHQSVEVCFSPRLYKFKLTRENFIVVIVDILRATTSICAAFDHGVEKIIPVAGVDEAKKYKQKGFIVACERDGKVLDFADVGNSPSDFQDDAFRGKTIAYSTTNGTKAIHLASDADHIVVGSFTNLTALSNWLKNQAKNVVVLCAAWKNLFNLEDSLFAGALSAKLLTQDKFITHCDSVKASLDLWSVAKPDLSGYLSKSSHRNRLKHLVSDEDFLYTITPDSNTTIPVLQYGYLVDMGK
jgi:2-phosphosulfolactate phosphatase